MPPQVSVVVSTFNRPQRLAALLEGLRAQTFPRKRFEVIVVDNGSGPETARVLEAELARGELPLRTVRHERTLGPAGGRNSGWRLARAELVAFTDDDCVPSPEWLAAALKAAKANPHAIVQGRTEPNPDELPGARALTCRTVSITELSPQFETCNILYPRAVLEELGGFDEAFGLWPAGEDTDLAWRAIGRGTEAVFAPEALVRHAVVRLGWIGALRDAARWGASARMVAREPGTRAILYGGVFWNVWHYLLVRSALSLVGPAWLRHLLVRRHVRALRRRARAAGAGEWAIPYLLAYDAIETVAMIRGAVRNRTLVL
ncbi:MAG TPA: glycosyltransferase [Solirubrobacteraceae bacterium]|jgi:GT2 family glycosyltransferase|nr:glycosyltransferase [Solirubrobacteraceae bacterium]